MRIFKFIIQYIVPGAVLLLLESCSSADIPERHGNMNKYPLRSVMSPAESFEEKENKAAEKINKNAALSRSEEEIKRLERERELIIIFSAAGITLIATVLIYIVYIRLKVKKKTETIISEKNDNIMNSLYFAESIQKAILPDTVSLRERLKNYFLIFRPKDIVSGDFYWIKTIDDKIFIVVADCTGHGIPGAFMSTIGTTMLNHIVLELKIHEPASILEALNINIRSALKQEKKDSSSNDGMDLAFCVYEPHNHKLLFSGANRPLYIVNNNAVQEFKGDRATVGGKQKEERRKYTNYEIPVNPGDSIYLFTDGITDQNNAEKEKLGKKNLKKLISDIAVYDMAEQGIRIKDYLNNHQGKMEQRDDITILGVKLN